MKSDQQHPETDSSSQLALFRGSDRWVQRFSVASTSRSGVIYTIGVDAAGELGCSCPAWIYSSSRAACKHLRSFDPANPQHQEVPS